MARRKELIFSINKPSLRLNHWWRRIWQSAWQRLLNAPFSIASAPIPLKNRRGKKSRDVQSVVIENVAARWRHCGPAEDTLGCCQSLRRQQACVRCAVPEGELPCATRDALSPSRWQSRVALRLGVLCLGNSNIDCRPGSVYMVMQYSIGVIKETSTYFFF